MLTPFLMTIAGAKAAGMLHNSSPILGWNYAAGFKRYSVSGASYLARGAVAYLRPV
jgi:hypothetical protein